MSAKREVEGGGANMRRSAPSLRFMTEAIWQRRYLSLLFFIQGLDAAQRPTAHAHAAQRCGEDIHHGFSWELMERVFEVQTSSRKTPRPVSLCRA